MPRHRLSFCERRRRALRLKAGLDQFEHRSTVTPIGATAMGLGLLPVAGQVGSMREKLVSVRFSPRENRTDTNFGPAISAHQ